MRTLDRKDAIVLYVPDMSHLRYYGPLLDNLVDANLKQRLILAYSIKNSKYNGLAHKHNIDRFKIIYERYFKQNSVEIECVDGVDVIKCDIAITVDCDKLYQTLFDCRKHLAIQHGIDCGDVMLGKYRMKNTIQILSNDLYKCLIDTSANCAVLDYPISCWKNRHENHIDELIDLKQLASCVFIFYPEMGLNGIVDDVVDVLQNYNLTPIFKQRQKNQLVHLSENVMYDHLWYPCESIVMPLYSCLTVGIGTSAYTDLAHAGVKFLDLALPHYSKTYPKPQYIHNFEAIIEYDKHKLTASIERLLSTSQLKLDRVALTRKSITQFINLLN